MNFFSPLEQFELSIIFPLSFFNLDISITNMVVYFFLSVALLFFYFYLCFNNPRLIPTLAQYMLELVYYFIFGLLKEQTSGYGYQFFPMYFCVFLFILFSNLFGLLPFSFTATAHIAITFALALAFNLAFIVLGFYEHGFGFLRLFVPNGAPVFLLPLIVVIEIVSYLIRTLSLSVRLFANMMAGHTLLHILASFSVGFANFKGLSVMVFVPLIVIFLVFFLELGIAFIQAYVFTILLCIYMNDSYFPSH